MASRTAPFLLLVTLCGCMAPGHGPSSSSEPSKDHVSGWGFEVQGSGTLHISLAGGPDCSDQLADYRIRAFFPDGSIHDASLDLREQTAGGGVDIVMPAQGTARLALPTCFFAAAQKTSDLNVVEWDIQNGPSGGGRYRHIFVDHRLSWPEDFVGDPTAGFAAATPVDVAPTCVPYLAVLSPPTFNGNSTLSHPEGWILLRARSVATNVVELTGDTNGPQPRTLTLEAHGEGDVLLRLECQDIPDSDWGAAGMQVPDASRYAEDLAVTFQPPAI